MNMTREEFERLVDRLADEQLGTKLAHEDRNVLVIFATRLLEETALSIVPGSNGEVIFTQGLASKIYRYNATTNHWEQVA